MALMSNIALWNQCIWVSLTDLLLLFLVSLGETLHNFHYLLVVGFLATGQAAHQWLTASILCFNCVVVLKVGDWDRNRQVFLKRKKVKSKESTVFISRLNYDHSTTQPQ